MNQQISTILSIKQFSEKHPAFTEGSLRWLIYQSTPKKYSKGEIPANGFDHALVRIGRRVLIDEERFFQWIRR